MSHIKRSLVSSGIVLLCVGSVVVGNNRRTQVDAGDVPDVGQAGPSSGPAVSGDLVAFNGPVVDRISEATYYKAVTELLKEKYVDPVTDDAKLVGGAIRGMIVSLNDPDSVYMDADEFRAFLKARTGAYEGIGAELVLEYSAEDKKAAANAQASDDPAVDAAAGIRIPRLVVALVVPGGPADRAGVKVGDWVDSVDGKWVVNSAPLRRLRDLQIQVQKGRAKQSDLNKLRQELRDKSRASVLPARARDRLIVGDKGELTVKWVRGGSIRTTVLNRGLSKMPDTLKRGSSEPIRLQFIPQEAAKLKQVVAGRAQVVIDLRGNVIGDFKSMKECLAVLAPAGAYGYVTREQGPPVTPLTLAAGNAKPPKVTLLVDSTTSNVAEVFALALSAKGIAKLSGTEMANDRAISEVVALPNGTGYTLVTGKFVVAKPSSKRPAKKVVTMGDWSPPIWAPEGGVVCSQSRRAGAKPRRAA